MNAPRTDAASPEGESTLNSNATETPAGLSKMWLLKAAVVMALFGAFSVYCVGLPAQAASLATSSASSALDSLSTSVGVFSNAVSGVSTSSSPGGGKVAQGEYRIEQAQALPGSPARMAVTLQPTQASAAEGAQPWQLRLPADVFSAAELQPGQVLAIRERPYGFGLWRSQDAQPFYLVVHDTWAQALQARPVPVN